MTFLADSNGGKAELITHAGGIVDFSQSSGPGGNHSLSVGSIDGGGTYELGADQLFVGSNGRSGNVSGLIEDGGAGGGIGASLIKVGHGTLKLSGPGGASQYSGGTTLKAAGPRPPTSLRATISRCIAAASPTRLPCSPRCTPTSRPSATTMAARTSFSCTRDARRISGAGRVATGKASRPAQPRPCRISPAGGSRPWGCRKGHHPSSRAGGAERLRSYRRLIAARHPSSRRCPSLRLHRRTPMPERARASSSVSPGRSSMLRPAAAVTSRQSRAEMAARGIVLRRPRLATTAAGRATTARRLSRRW